MIRADSAQDDITPRCRMAFRAHYRLRLQCRVSAVAGEKQPRAGLPFSRRLYRPPAESPREECRKWVNDAILFISMDMTCEIPASMGGRRKHRAY